MKQLFLLLSLILPASIFAQTEQECLEFLYESMPLPDKVDYSLDFFKKNVESTLRAKREMPWGERIPRREFMHFVLPVRVNNENMDESRMVFYESLRKRIEGLSMADAILEVNHWCHEKVTYTPSDERTSSPLASMRTAYGRCGEESTFLVAALRSVCIPARQVYTPRWAHTDDNHAWVEAWADGKWHFLGACEPEAVLDLGWFNAPASRGMLMHTKAFGNYDGPEEVMQRTACFTEIDVTKGYAPIARRLVQVVDTQGYPVANATVEFKIYNYAEFYTVSRKTTDANGMTYMQAGCGDLLAWASKDGVYGFSKCSMREADTLKITLSHKAGERYYANFKIVPPAERNTVPDITDEQRLTNTMRLIAEDSIRNAYIATFATESMARQLAQQHGLDASEVWKYVQASRGNHACIMEFLSKAKDRQKAMRILKYLSAKDLRDVSIDVLNDNLNNAPEGVEDETFDKYVLCPRVANEMLSPYRGFLLAQTTSKAVGGSPEGIAEWVHKNIKTDALTNPQNLRMTPIGVWKNRKTDLTSMSIFFVALCRSFGFPARIDAVTGKTEYLDMKSHEWINVSFYKTDEYISVAKGTLKASYTPDEYVLNPKYYTHFTVSKIENSKPALLNYAEEDTWASTLKDGAVVDAGDYLITSGTRLADGSALVHLEVVNVAPESEVTVPLLLPKQKDEIAVIGSFNSENIYDDWQQGSKSILSTTGRGYYVLGIIAPNNEPTNHALRDIALVKEEFDKAGIATVLLTRTTEDKTRFNITEFPSLPRNTSFGTDTNGKIWSELTNEMHIDTPTLPVFVIADTFNRIVYMSKGYTIGLGETLSRVIKTINKK